MVTMMAFWMQIVRRMKTTAMPMRNMTPAWESGSGRMARNWALSKELGAVNQNWYQQLWIKILFDLLSHNIPVQRKLMKTAPKRLVSSALNSPWDNFSAKKLAHKSFFFILCPFTSGILPLALYLPVICVSYELFMLKMIILNAQWALLDLILLMSTFR